MYLTNAGLDCPACPSGWDRPMGQTKQDQAALNEEIVREVAAMISDWEVSDELTTPFARRLVEFVLTQSAKAR